MRDIFTIKSLLWAILIASLSGCGGDGESGGTNGSPIIIPQIFKPYVVLTNQSNGDGVARGVVGNSVSLVYSSSIAGVVDSANASSPSAPTTLVPDLNPANFPITQSSTGYALRKGTYSSAGTTLNLSILINSSTSSALGFYFEIPGSTDSLVVFGDKLTSPPVSGTFSYSGILTQNARSIAAPGEIGTFKFTVDFANRTFTIQGSTTNLTMTGSGVIDVVTGLYATSNLTVNARGAAYTGTMYGNLNATNAIATSGVFYTNGSIPQYSGSFIGSR